MHVYFSCVKNRLVMRRDNIQVTNKKNRGYNNQVKVQ